MKSESQILIADEAMDNSTKLLCVTIRWIDISFTIHDIHEDPIELIDDQKTDSSTLTTLIKIAWFAPSYSMPRSGVWWCS